MWQSEVLLHTGGTKKKGIIFYTIFWQSPCKCWKFVAAWQKQQMDAKDYLWEVQ